MPQVKKELQPVQVAAWARAFRAQDRALEQASVSSKCQALITAGGGEKLTSKGVQQKRALEPWLKQEGKTFCQVLEEAQDDTYPALQGLVKGQGDVEMKPIPEVTNRGFRVDPDQKEGRRSQMMTYEVAKPVPNMFYIKRLIQPDCITTLPIDAPLKPHKVVERERAVERAEAKRQKRLEKEAQKGVVPPPQKRRRVEGVEVEVREEEEGKESEGEEGDDVMRELGLTTQEDYDSDDGIGGYDLI